MREIERKINDKERIKEKERGRKKERTMDILRD